MQYFFDKTLDCFNNIAFILVATITSKKVCEKRENNSTLEKVLLVCKLERRAVAVSRSNFWFQSGFSQKDKEEKFDNCEKFAMKNLPIFVLSVCRLLTFELSNMYWKCSENCNTLTERTYDNAVFKIVFNIITIFIFIAQ